MKQIIADIIENKRISTSFYKMTIKSGYLAKNSKPGQFLEVRCSKNGTTLLRRPFGVHRIFKNSVEILYEIVGSGTNLLAKKKKGDIIDIIGPLGNGFTLPRSPAPGPRTTILIAGGIGVAPLVALAEDLRKKKSKVTVMIGARTKSHILCEKEFRSLGCSLIVATEDGSKGRKGLATDLLRMTHDAVRSTIYACGPTAMLTAVAEIAGEKRMPCQVSLEERMACGVGVCLGCPVKVKEGGYKMVCKDGPVFNAEDIAW